jgi:hypothetical protein
MVCCSGSDDLRQTLYFAVSPPPAKSSGQSYLVQVDQDPTLCYGRGSGVDAVLEVKIGLEGAKACRSATKGLIS